MITIDRTSPVPLYFQLAQHFEAAIRPGALKAGSRLDNEVQLAERLGLSRPPVRAAFQYLSNKGLVVRKRGAGTLAANERIDRDAELTSLHDNLAAAGPAAGHEGDPQAGHACWTRPSATGPASPPPPSGQVAGRAARAAWTPAAGPAPCLGSLLFAADDLVLCHGPDMRPPRPAALAFPPDDSY